MAALDGLAVGTSIAENLSHKYDLKARPHALHVVRAWAAKGYQPIYLSGRQVTCPPPLVAHGHRMLGWRQHGILSRDAASNWPGK